MLMPYTGDTLVFERRSSSRETIHVIVERAGAPSSSAAGSSGAGASAGNAAGGSHAHGTRAAATAAAASYDGLVPGQHQQGGYTAQGGVGQGGVYGGYGGMGAGAAQYADVGGTLDQAWR
jgi:hypothetical protein